ncbi:hypothetical protein C3B55_00814 [Candidatus Pseudomonas adelgestsugas]|uniref:Uncharacterized protein n=1 Tax=Candidatus Pseudomonas adelgestsugas TaxID=1302376 RepID=A0ABX5R9M4_9PSED|nr:hypothetical protein C3B55_00814 [Candidatus Pseudomonas adelgestsugas]
MVTISMYYEILSLLYCIVIKRKTIDDAVRLKLIATLKLCDELSLLLAGLLIYKKTKLLYGGHKYYEVCACRN